MKPDAPWLKQPDPYTGLMENPPSPPVTEVTVIDMLAEPQHVLKVGPGGQVLGRRRAPRGTCACGQRTTRRVCGTVWIGASTVPGERPSEMVFHAEGIYECPNCARSR